MSYDSRVPILAAQIDTSLVRVPMQVAEIGNCLLRVLLLGAQMATNLLSIPLLAAQLGTSLLSLPLLAAQLGTGHLHNLAARADDQMRQTVAPQPLEQVPERAPREVPPPLAEHYRSGVAVAQARPVGRLG